MVVFGYKLLYSVKEVVIGQDGCIRAKWFFWEKSDCIRANIFLILESGCIWEKVVAFGQNGCIRAKWL